MDWDISVAMVEAPIARSRPLLEADLSATIRLGIVELAKRCSETLLSLYSQRHNSKPDSLLKVATRIHQGLYKWHEQLPAELDWPRRDGNDPLSPGILVMQ